MGGGGQALRPGSRAGQRHPDSGAALAPGARSCSAVATATLPRCGWRWTLGRSSLRQVHLLQGQARWRGAATGPRQEAHEVLAVPRQAARVGRTGRRPPTLGSMVARWILANGGGVDPWGCGRRRRGRRVPAAETAEARVMDRR